MNKMLNYIIIHMCNNNNNIIIITLFESQIILAEHECCTNWGECKSNKSNQINTSKNTSKKHPR